jgi:hypothetical protein
VAFDFHVAFSMILPVADISREIHRRKWREERIGVGEYRGKSEDFAVRKSKIQIPADAARRRLQYYL